MRNERKSDNEEIDQSVRDMIDSYGEPDEPLPVSVNEWIYATYDFINAVLSGYYDEEEIISNVFWPLIKGETNDRDFNNGYVRYINWEG